MNVGRFSILICVLSFLLVQMVMAQETSTTKPRSGIGNKIFQQTYNADSVREILDNMPYFSLFKDNYFIGGTTIGGKPTVYNSDIKFQLSISQRLTKSRLPFDTYLFAHPPTTCIPLLLEDLQANSVVVP